MAGMASGQKPNSADLQSLLGQAATATGNGDKLKEMNHMVGLVEKAKKGDIEAAVTEGVQGNKDLQALAKSTNADKLVKQVKSGDVLKAATTATDSASKMVGGKGGDKLKENMGQVIKIADAVEKKDAGKAL